MQKKICVLGSINYDTSIMVDNLPLEGETIKGNNVITSPGGKGLKQAVTLARLQQTVTFIGAVGKDLQGEFLKDIFTEEGISTATIQDSDLATGVAWITIGSSGKNTIVVYEGANKEVTVPYVQQHRQSIEDAEILVAQFEVPMESIEEAFRIARAANVLTVLNPAPAREISNELLANTDVFVPNETEIAEILHEEFNYHDLTSAQAQLKPLFAKGMKLIIVTLGKDGVLVSDGETIEVVPAFVVDAIDTTAAGDSFIGALVSQLEKNEVLKTADMKNKIQCANKFASIVVQHIGAYNSIPRGEQYQIASLRKELGID